MTDTIEKAIKMTDKRFEAFAEEVSALVYWDGGVSYPWEGTAAVDAELFADMVRVMASAPAAVRDAFLAKWRSE